MKLGELQPAAGAKTKDFRRGRGHGSGNGKTAGKGHKGQKARSGAGGKVGFEGGQLTLYRRLPKRGMIRRNFRKKIVAINLRHLNVFDENAVVDIAALQSKGLVSHPRDGVKILGEGTIDRKLTVRVNFFSSSAKEKIEAAGGTAEVV
jgi:large subunit ribosomal protein L15